MVSLISHARSQIKSASISGLPAEGTLPEGNADPEAQILARMHIRHLINCLFMHWLITFKKIIV